MKVSILTYNVLFSKAFDELVELVRAHQPDIVCLQEFEITDASLRKIEALDYELADYAHSFFKHFKFYGVVTFYNPKTLRHRNGEAVDLARSLYELVLFVLRLGKVPRTALNNQFYEKGTSKIIDVYNLHLTPIVYGGNGPRNKQLEHTMRHVQAKSATNPTIITGDFNYPFKKSGLEKLFQSYGFAEATNNLFFTWEGLYLWFFKIKAKTDFILYKNITHKKTHRLDRIKSDHYPIIAEFEF